MNTKIYRRLFRNESDSLLFVNDGVLLKIEIRIIFKWFLLTEQEQAGWIQFSIFHKVKNEPPPAFSNMRKESLPYYFGEDSKDSHKDK